MSFDTEKLLSSIASNLDEINDSLKTIAEVLENKLDEVGNCILALEEEK